MSRSTSPTATPHCTAPGCGRPCPDAFLCRSHVDALRADLLAVPELHDDLLVTFARLDELELDVATVRDAGLDPHPLDEPIAETKLIYDPAAGDVMRALHVELHGWVRHLVEQRYGADLDLWSRERARAVAGELGPWRRAPRLPDDDTAELARWLARHMESIRADEAAGELAASIGRLVPRAREIVCPPPLRYLGHCDVCEAAAGVRVELRCERGASVVSCERCGDTWRVELLEELLLERARAQLVTATEASRALPELLEGVLPEGRQLTASMIRNYGARGRIARHRTRVRDSAGAVVVETRYKVGDLLDLARKIREDDRSRNGRGTPRPLD